MRDADLEALLAEEAPHPCPQRRRIARARALNAFERSHQRGIGAAVARHLVRSSAPAWRLLADTVESPWTKALVYAATSLVALFVFTVALIVGFMVTG